MFSRFFAVYRCDFFILSIIRDDSSEKTACPMMKYLYLCGNT